MEEITIKCKYYKPLSTKQKYPNACIYACIFNIQRVLNLPLSIDCRKLFKPIECNAGKVTLEWTSYIIYCNHNIKE